MFDFYSISPAPHILNPDEVYFPVRNSSSKEDRIMDDILCEGERRCNIRLFLKKNK